MTDADDTTSKSVSAIAQGVRNGLLGLARHWWPTVAAIAGPAALAVGGASPAATFEIGGHHHHWRPVLITLGIVILAVAAIFSAKRQRRLEHLEIEHKGASEDAKARARGLLRLIFLELEALREAAGHLSNERLSLFRFDFDHFVLVARRSASPTYDRRFGRQEYPENEGCIGTAWKSGKGAAEDLPVAGQEQPWSEEWLASQERLGVSRSVAEGLHMPSRSYFAFRIEGGERSMGVLVFESLNSAAQADQMSLRASLSVEKLEPIFKAASGRLSHLLRESECVSAALIAELLPQLKL